MEKWAQAYLVKKALHAAFVKTGDWLDDINMYFKNRGPTPSVAETPGFAATSAPRLPSKGGLITSGATAIYRPSRGRPDYSKMDPKKILYDPGDVDLGDRSGDSVAWRLSREQLAQNASQGRIVQPARAYDQSLSYGPRNKSVSPTPEGPIGGPAPPRPPVVPKAAISGAATPGAATSSTTKFGPATTGGSQTLPPTVSVTDPSVQDVPNAEGGAPERKILDSPDPDAVAKGTHLDTSRLRSTGNRAQKGPLSPYRSQAGSQQVSQPTNPQRPSFLGPVAPRVHAWQRRQR